MINLCIYLYTHARAHIHTHTHTHIYIYIYLCHTSYWFCFSGGSLIIQPASSQSLGWLQYPCPRVGQRLCAHKAGGYLKPCPKSQFFCGLGIGVVLIKLSSWSSSLSPPSPSPASLPSGFRAFCSAHPAGPRCQHEA